MKKDDLISRAAAIEEMRRFSEVMLDNGCKPGWYDAVKIVKEAPAVDAAPVVHGEWKWSHGGQCSECGFHNSNFDYNFCPNCGAKMDADKHLAFADQSGAEYADNPTV